MQNYEPMRSLPIEIQAEWRASLEVATATDEGAFRLVNIRKTSPKSFEEQRIIVLVVDENGFPVPNVKIAFSFDTANFYTIDSSFKWSPPFPTQAFIVPTQGSGQIDMIQGSAVKPGQPGGMTVYCLEPEYSSDIVRGLGMQNDHTGLHLTFQLRRNGVLPLMSRLDSIEARLDYMEQAVKSIMAQETVSARPAQ